MLFKPLYYIVTMLFYYLHFYSATEMEHCLLAIIGQTGLRFNPFSPLVRSNIHQCIKKAEKQLDLDELNLMTWLIFRIVEVFHYRIFLVSTSLTSDTCLRMYSPQAERSWNCQSAIVYHLIAFTTLSSLGIITRLAETNSYALDLFQIQEKWFIQSSLFMQWYIQ